MGNDNRIFTLYTVVYFLHRITKSTSRVLEILCTDQARKFCVHLSFLFPFTLCLNSYWKAKHYIIYAHCCNQENTTRFGIEACREERTWCMVPLAANLKAFLKKKGKNIPCDKWIFVWEAVLKKHTHWQTFMLISQLFSISSDFKRQSRIFLNVTFLFDIFQSKHYVY